jgi:hypothetical protein
MGFVMRFVMRVVFRGSGDYSRMRSVSEESTVFIGEGAGALEAGLPVASLFAGCQWHARIIRQTACDVVLTIKLRRKLLEWS